MKQIKQIYALLLAVTLPLLTACYNDDATTVDTPTQQDGKIKVHLRVSQAAPTTTRALWQDNNATDDEMMNVWTVVAVNNNEGADKNKVVGIWSCKPSGEPDREIDEIDAELSREGNYRFYSFANMSPQKVMDLLHITPSTTTTDSEKVLASAFSSSVGNNTVVEIAFDDGATVAPNYNIAVNVKGNDFDPASTEDNGFGATGIPMSNVQTFNLKEGDKKDLIVIRMLAKIKLQIYNDSGKKIEITSVTLTSLTANDNDDNNGNLMLLPELKSKGNNKEDEDGHNTMNYIHGDIQPNLNGTPKTEKVAFTVTNGTIDASGHTSKDGEKKALEVTFYVNESDVRKKDSSSSEPTDPTAPSTTRAADDAPDFYHFILEIVTDGDETLRYTMIDDERDNDGTIKDDWGYIARNDYRIIPIVLDDYKLELIPYDFPAIGVYPASVKEEDGIYTINFHDYGHFHLQPQVTKFSTSEIVDFTSETPRTVPTETVWGLIGNDFRRSWKSWTDATKANDYDNKTGQFYRNQDGTKDGDEVGGVPVWYPNTSSPRWQPNTTIGYRPFIFGYINDPGNTMNGDNKVYHEFSINLYKKGMSTPRLMTYRLYMILDKSQMMYPKSSRRHGVSAVRHTHGY